MGLRQDKHITAIILENWGEIEGSVYDGDFVVGLADSLLPVYYNEIMEEWQHLPMDYQDNWQDYGVDSDTTITKLMTIDLFHYYYDKVSELLTKLQEDTNNA